MLKSFDCVYEGKRYPVMASTHLAARSLGVRHIANVLGACEPSKVAVVDLEIAAGYKPARYMNITETLVGTVDLSLPLTDGERAFLTEHERLHAMVQERRQRAERRARADAAMDRRFSAEIGAKQRELCVCVAGYNNRAQCTCKSYERAVWAVRNEAFDTKLANAHLDGLTDGR